MEPRALNLVRRICRPRRGQWQGTRRHATPECALFDSRYFSDLITLMDLVGCQGNPSSLQNEPRADPGRQGIPTPSNSIPSSRIHNRPFVTEDALHSHGVVVPQHSQGGVLPSSSGQPQPSQSSVPPSEEKKHICSICGKGFAR